MNPMEIELENLLHDLKQKLETVLEDIEAEIVLYRSRARGDFDRLYERERRIALDIKHEGIAL